ncbi:pancreatic triacylglycerol lipase-like [Amblyomma americanum]
MGARISWRALWLALLLLGPTAMRPASGRHRRRTLGLLEKCMPDLGCFRSGGNWFHLLYRPVSLLPDDRHLVNTTFLLFTRENPVIQEFLQPNVEHLLRRTVFQPHRPTKIIVHGFMDNIIVGKWLFDMKDRFLETMDCNVVVVDWRGGNVLPYSQATANCRVVGAEIAFLVKMIERVLGTSQSSFHCVGHSLGAQICGYAGARLQNLGRISGLDPAGPLFYRMHPDVRLDPSDANFVDVIHSDASLPYLLLEGFGVDQMVGHLDFYPNNGNNQPGCQKYNFRKFVDEGGLIEGVRRLSSCDHIRSLDYYMESITRDMRCLPVAVSCPSWEQFEAGRCSRCGAKGSDCAVMGLYADRMKTSASGERMGRKLYLKTNDGHPFCLHQYQVAVQMSKTPKRAVWDAFGQLYLNMKGKFHIRLGKRPQDIRGGRRYTYYMTTREEVSDASELGLEWNNLDPEVDNRLFVHSVKLRPFDGFFKRGKKSLHHTLYCANNSYALPSGEEIFLQETDFCPEY